MATVNPLTINPGDLRHSILIEQLSASGDSWTDSTPEWTTVLSTRASINELGGFSPKEVLSQGELSSVSTHLVTIRYNPAAIVAGMRVNLSGKLFRIQVVQNVLERNRILRLFVVDLQSNAE